MSKLTTQDRLNIVELAKSGKSQVEISRMYNISANTVYTIIERAKHGNDLSGTSASRRLSKQEIDSLINDLKNREETGATIVQLAVQYGVSEHTICRYIERYSLHMKKEATSKLSDDQKQNVYEQYTNGVSATELSEKFGVSTNTIYKIVRDLRKSDEQIAGTVKVITEQFNSELNEITDCTFIDDIDKGLLSESTIKLLDDIENKKKELFEKYKDYSLELIRYTEYMNTVSGLVKAELEEKYKYLQSKFERMAS